MQITDVQITEERITRVEVESYEGLVFNLETEHEEYIVNGIVVHNCPHIWSTQPDKIARSECGELWMGE